MSVDDASGAVAVAVLLMLAGASSVVLITGHAVWHVAAAAGLHAGMDVKVVVDGLLQPLAAS
jgi:hypothetical protein